MASYLHGLFGGVELLAERLFWHRLLIDQLAALPVIETSITKQQRTRTLYFSTCTRTCTCTCTCIYVHVQNEGDGTYLHAHVHLHVHVQSCTCSIFWRSTRTYHHYHHHMALLRPKIYRRVCVRRTQACTWSLCTWGRCFAASVLVFAADICRRFLRLSPRNAPQTR